VVGWQWYEGVQNGSAVILVVKSWPGWQWLLSYGEEQWLVAVVAVAVGHFYGKNTKTPIFDPKTPNFLCKITQKHRFSHQNPPFPIKKRTDFARIVGQKLCQGRNAVHRQIGRQGLVACFK
jgi:hypothetical protein